VSLLTGVKMVFLFPSLSLRVRKLVELSYKSLSRFCLEMTTHYRKAGKLSLILERILKTNATYSTVGRVKVTKCNSADITVHVAACAPRQQIQKKILKPSSCFPPHPV